MIFVGLGRPGSDFSFKCHRKGNDVFVVNGLLSFIIILNIYIHSSFL